MPITMKVFAEDTDTTGVVEAADDLAGAILNESEGLSWFAAWTGSPAVSR